MSDKINYNKFTVSNLNTDAPVCVKDEIPNKC